MPRDGNKNHTMLNFKRVCLSFVVQLFSQGSRVSYIYDEIRIKSRSTRSDDINVKMSCLSHLALVKLVQLTLPLLFKFFKYLFIFCFFYFVYRVFFILFIKFFVLGFSLVIKKTLQEMDH